MVPRPEDTFSTAFKQSFTAECLEQRMHLLSCLIFTIPATSPHGAMIPVRCNTKEIMCLG